MVLATPPNPQTNGVPPPVVPPTQAPPAAPATDDGAPQPSPLGKTHLILDDDRLKWLVNRAEVRIAEVMEEMGRNMDGSVKPGSWMAERKQNQESYDKDLEWRRSIGGSIFADGMNLTFADSGRKARLLSARVRDDLLGTSPFFGCMTERSGNPKLTKQVEEYEQEQIENSNVPKALREGIRIALVRNEAVIETTYFVDKTTFTGSAQGVFVDANGQPVKTSKGEYVYDKDDITPDPNTDGLFRLNKDPSFAFQKNQYALSDFDSLPQTLTHYDGVQSQVVDFRDFLCPLKYDDVHAADINVRLTELTEDQVRSMYGWVATADAYFSHRGSQTGANQPIRIRGEEEEAQSLQIAKLLIATVYLRCDADQDGKEEEIMLVHDLTNHEPIFYDYLGNHMSKRPFAVLPGVEKVAGRWYGIGVFSKMAHQELYADAMLNRSNAKDSRIASITLMHKDAILEVKNGEPLMFGTDKVYTINPTFDPQKGAPVIRLNLLENAELTMDLMEKMRQAGDQEFGVVTSANASAMDFNQSKTATGILDIQKDADVISKDMEQDISAGIVEVIAQAVELDLDNMDEQVVAFSKDGSELVTLNRDEIRHLGRDVKLLMTKSRSAAALAATSNAEAVWMRFMKLTPEEQMWGRKLYVSQLKSLGVDSPDDLLPEVTQQDVDAWKQQQAQAQAQDNPVSESIAVKLPDLVPSERAQALQKMGIQAASVQEVAANDAQKLGTKIAEKQATQPPPTERPKTAS